MWFVTHCTSWSEQCSTWECVLRDRKASLMLEWGAIFIATYSRSLWLNFQFTGGVAMVDMVCFFGEDIEDIWKR